MKKRSLAIAALVLSLFASGTFVYAAKEDSAPVSQGTGFEVKVIQTSDIHAYLEELTDEETGVTTNLGMPKLKSLIDDKTDGYDLSLVLDSGDAFHGQSIATMADGETAARLMGACGYDAMVSGNHDWNYGKDRLKELEAVADENNGDKEFRILAGNVEVDADGSKFFDHEEMIKEVTKNGITLKVGIFGVIDPRVYPATAPANVEGLTFTDMTAYATEKAAALRQQGCQIVIGLAHCINPTAPEGLSHTAEGVDIWLDGHEHMIFDEPAGQDTASYSTEAGYHLNCVNDISIECTLAEDGSLAEAPKTVITTINADEAGSAYQPDPAVETMLNGIKAEQETQKSEVVGYTPEELDGVWENVRIGETTLGRAVTAAYLKETGADIAFENAGGIRSSIDAGDVTYGEVLDVFPYGNYVVTRKLTGSEVKAVLEQSLNIQYQNRKANDAGDYDGWPDNSGQTLQVGGIAVTYAFENENAVLVSATVKGEELQDDKEYVVATNNYLVTDETTYPQLAQNKENLNEYSACEDILAAYLDKENLEAVSRDLTTPSMTPQEENPQTPVPSETKEAAASGEPESEKPEAASASGEKAESVQTGDESPAALYLLLALAGLTGIIAVRKRISYKKQ